jgi:hypothetical protein
VLSKYTAWIAVDRSRTTDTVIVRTIHQPDYGLDAPSSPASHGIFYSRYLPSASSRRNLDASFFNLQSSVRYAAYDFFEERLSFDDDVADNSDDSILEFDLAIEVLAARIYASANNAGTTEEELQDLVELIQRLVDRVNASGQISPKSVRRLKRLLAQCFTALMKGDLETVRTRLRKIADQLPKAE